LYNTHISSSTPTTYSSFLKKRINALIFVLGTCCTSFSLFNELVLMFSRG